MEPADDTKDRFACAGDDRFFDLLSRAEAELPPLMLVVGAETPSWPLPIAPCVIETRS